MVFSHLQIGLQTIQMVFSYTKMVSTQISAVSPLDHAMIHGMISFVFI